MDHRPTVKIEVRPIFSQKEADELASYEWQEKTKEQIEEEIFDHITNEGIFDFFSFSVEVK